MPQSPLNAENKSSISYLIIFLYLLSGVAALCYEILWNRMLSLQFGVSIFGVVITITGFLLGLGIGAYAGLKLLKYSRRLLFIFASLELAIAGFALLSPQLIQLSDAFLQSQASSLSLYQWYTLQGTTLIFVLLLPGLAMGAGFPVIINIARQQNISLGAIYGVNTLGGAIGALLPLWLLPTYGWFDSMRFTAVINVFIAVVTFSVSRSFKLPESAPEPQDTSNLKEIPRIQLLAYFGIGMAALMLEVSWTRLFGMIMLRTEYVLALILAIYLIGIGLGSLIGSKLKSKQWLNHFPWIAACGGLLSLVFFPQLSAGIENSQFNSLFSAIIIEGLSLALLTFPLTFILGAWLPMISANFATRTNSGVIFYSVNSIGAALGAIITGFVLIPYLGSTYTLFLASFFIFILGCAWANVKWIYAFGLLFLVAFPWAKFPPAQVLLPKTLEDMKTLFLHEDSLAITHVLEKKDGQRILLSDLQRMDAATDPASVEIQKNQARLPLLLHKNPKSILFLGLGTGISASASLPYPSLQKTGVELSEGAIEAINQYFSPVNQSISKHLKIYRDDARRFLMLSNKKYDVIVGDLFHPDLVGRSTLLSVQQFQRAKQRLTQNGVFVQWIALNQFDKRGLQIVMRSFKKAFPDAVMFVDAFRIAFVGSPGPERYGKNALENMARLPANIQKRVTGGEGVMTWLSRYWGKIPDSRGPLQDEWAPTLEYHLPKARYNGEINLFDTESYVLSLRPSSLQAANELGIPKQDDDNFKKTFAASTLAEQAWLASFGGDNKKSAQLMQKAFRLNKDDRWISFAFADQLMSNMARLTKSGIPENKILQSILKIRPDHPEALRRLWIEAKQNGNLNQATEYRQRLLDISPLDKSLKN